MRILYCNKYNFPFSGTEVYLFELMQMMREHGHEVALFSMRDERGQRTDFDRYFMQHTDFKEAGKGFTRRVSARRGARAQHLSPSVAVDFLGA